MSRGSSNSVGVFRASLALVVVATGLVGCRGQESDDPPVVIIRNMYDQPKYVPQDKSEYFADSRTMRPPVEGTVARSRFEPESELATGRLADDSGYVLDVPEAVAARHGGREAFVQRGQDRFNIYCTPCHAATGLGDGTVVRRGFQKPPSLHDARIREMPDGQLYATIKNGVRNMPAYGAQIPQDDRWAIVSYVRALELTQISQLEPRK